MHPTMSTSTRLAALLVLLACRAATAEEIAVAARPPAEERKVAILVFDGVELLDFSGPGEVFAAASGSSGHGFRVFTVAKTKAAVTSQGFVHITPEFTIGDCPAPDIVVLPGGNVPDQDPELQAWVKRCSGSAELVMSVCNGAFLLAETGLLDGLEATTHHGSLAALTANFPRTRVLTNRRFVDSGRVMTCAGVSAGIDGALHVVERLLGQESAKRTARYMEYEWRPDEIAAQHAEAGRSVGDGPNAKLALLVRTQGVEAALAAYRSLTDPPAEHELIADGFTLLQVSKGAEARALLELAVTAFPDSARARDSLSQACEVLGDEAAAIRLAEEALAKSKTQAGLDPVHAKRIQNAAASRLVRLGQGDKRTLRYGCPPCGGRCDETRYVSGGPCPMCGMEMTARGAGE
jgi:transcriptional regulator GlxA family with amidase domain